MNQSPSPPNQRSPFLDEEQYAHPAQKKTNGIGIAGFVLALIGLFFGWVPLIGWGIWLLGVVFSVIGVTRKPRGLAIAGLAMSFVALVVVIILFLFASAGGGAIAPFEHSIF